MWYKKLSIWKAIADVFLYLSVLGMVSGWIKPPFYNLAIGALLFGLIVTIIYLVKATQK